LSNDRSNLNPVALVVVASAADANGESGPFSATLARSTSAWVSDGAHETPAA